MGDPPCENSSDDRNSVESELPTLLTQLCQDLALALYSCDELIGGG